jgi:hypothetical protein
MQFPSSMNERAPLSTRNSKDVEKHSVSHKQEVLIGLARKAHLTPFRDDARARAGG